MRRDECFVQFQRPAQVLFGLLQAPKAQIGRADCRQHIDRRPLRACCAMIGPQGDLILSGSHCPVSDDQPIHCLDDIDTTGLWPQLIGASAGNQTFVAVLACTCAGCQQA